MLPKFCYCRLLHSFIVALSNLRLFFSQPVKLSNFKRGLLYGTFPAFFEREYTCLNSNPSLTIISKVKLAILKVNVHFFKVLNIFDGFAFDIKGQWNFSIFNISISHWKCQSFWRWTIMIYVHHKKIYTVLRQFLMFSRHETQILYLF